MSVDIVEEGSIWLLTVRPSCACFGLKSAFAPDPKTDPVLGRPNASVGAYLYSLNRESQEGSLVLGF